MAEDALCSRVHVQVKLGLPQLDATFVAGIAALVLSANPNLTSSEVKTLLQDTARKIGKKSEYN